MAGYWAPVESVLAVLRWAHLAFVAMPASYENILAIKLREIGDAVIWTSALRSLRGAFPDSTIDVLVRDFTEPVLRGVSEIDRIHTVSGRGAPQLDGRGHLQRPGTQTHRRRPLNPACPTCYLGHRSNGL